jgi:hypothetical protein
VAAGRKKPPPPSPLWTRPPRRRRREPCVAFHLPPASPESSAPSDDIYKRLSDVRAEDERRWIESYLEAPADYEIISRSDDTDVFRQAGILCVRTFNANGGAIDCDFSEAAPDFIEPYEMATELEFQ